MSTSRKRIALYSVITAIIIVMGIIFPIYHLYDPLFGHNPAISVKNGYYNVTYSGNFKNYSSTDSFTMSSVTVEATVSDTNHTNSTLTVGIHRGEIFYVLPSSNILLDYIFSVNGQFTTNLRPSSLTLSYNASGLSDQGNTHLRNNIPPFPDTTPRSENVSLTNLGNLWLWGLGQKNVTSNLINESRSLPTYNFSLYVEMVVTLNWYSNSTHNFVLSATVNGLQQPVFASISMAIVEMNK